MMMIMMMSHCEVY